MINKRGEYQLKQRKLRMENAPVKTIAGFQSGMTAHTNIQDKSVRDPLYMGNGPRTEGKRIT